MPRTIAAALLPARAMTLGLLIACGLGAAAAAWCYRLVTETMDRTLLLHGQMEEAKDMIALVAESEAAKRLWILTGRLEDRDAMVRAATQLRERGRDLAGRLEAPLLERGLAPVGELLEHVLRLRDQVQAANERDGQAEAVRIAVAGNMPQAKATLRGRLGEMAEGHREELDQLSAQLAWGQVAGLAIIGAASLAMLGMLLGAVRLLGRRRAAAEAARTEMDRRGRETATLFSMGELLQNSLSPEDIGRVVSHTAEELLPEAEGAFYVFNNSRDRLDLLTAWGHCGIPPRVPEHFAPADCWALKRGRAHGQGVAGALACDHGGETLRCSLCVPMQARGEVHGLLQLHAPGREPLSPAQAALAQALADGVSLALANLALREKLRSQALRDPLTGLFNRRFLEETLPRMVAHAERRRAPVAVLMLDLDHFKQINDRHGHAVGDVVLREVAAALMAHIRRMDVACRYGGEELVVLMPDCGADDALARAEEICSLVRGLRGKADQSLPAVTVSIGVAVWPEHGEEMDRVIEAADAALYAAKRAGRDRALPAARTPVEA